MSLVCFLFLCIFSKFYILDLSEIGLTRCCTDVRQMNVAHQQLTTLTQGSLPTGIHLLGHLQGLGGGYVHIGWNNHQANGLLFFDELVNEILDLKLCRVQQTHIVTKPLLSFGSNIPKM